MTKELLISSSPHETRVAVLEDDQLVEVYFQRDLDSGIVGGIYKGRVNRVLPGMQSAFVNIGLERDAFLYVSDFFEDSEEYERVFTDAENRVARIGEGAAAGVIAGELPSADRAAGPDLPAASVSLPATDDVEAPPPSGDSEEPSAPTVSVPGEIAAPSSEVAVPPVIPAPSKTEERGESTRREFEKRDSRGRRHRRGRSFRENRFGPRRDAGEREYRAEGSSQPLEPLPGESLARYSRPAGSAGEAGASSAASLARSESGDTSGGAIGIDNRTPGDSSASAQCAGTDALRPVHPDPDATLAACGEIQKEKPTKAEDLSTTEAREGMSALGSESSESNSPEERRSFSLVSPLAAAEETLDEQVEIEPGELPDEPDAPYAQIETDGPDGPDEPSNPYFFAPSTSSGENVDESPAAPFSSDQETAGAGSESAPQPVEASQSSGQSYTLRDAHHRPRVAPRRGPKRGRGRFRGHQDRRPETGSAERSRSGNHQPLPINELLKEGQEILVQIAKEPLGTKGARITSHIALPGRYLVYMPTITHIGVSRKIGSDEERLRLRNILLENRGSLTGGFIVRTAGAGRSEEELKADLAFLTSLWNDIRARAERCKAPALLHGDLTLVERILRDLLSPDFKCVRVDNEIEYEHVLEFVNRFQPALIGHVKLYTRNEPLFEEFGVQAEIDRALKHKVWLKSGGYIVINQTEALVAIDVNTGKYVGKTNRLEDTIVKTNIDAVLEIVRQIRLRDLGGIIVIDFIDMDERRNRAKVVQALEDALRRDRAPTKILSFNEFGLVALTRKRAKQSLERTLCEPCPYCTGAGWVKSVATVSNEIVAESRKMATEIEGRSMTLRVNPQVAAHLKSKGGVLISEIEAASRKEVTIKGDSAVHQERFEIF